MKTISLNKYSMKVEGISQSLYAHDMACPKRFLFAAKGYTKVNESLPMTLGSYGHHLLEFMRLGKHVPTYTFPQERTPEEREFIIAATTAIVEEYVKIYPISKIAKKHFIPEYVIDNVKLPNGVRLRGKIDGRCISILSEYKFKSRISEDDMDIVLNNDWQVMFYCVMNYLQENLITGVEYDVFRYPSFTKKKPKEVYNDIKAGIKAEPDHWIKRWNIDIKEEHIKEFMNFLTEKTSETLERAVWYKNICACKSMFTCPYLKLCYLGKDPEIKIKPLFQELYDDGYKKD